MRDRRNTSLSLSSISSSASTASNSGRSSLNEKRHSSPPPPSPSLPPPATNPIRLKRRSRLSMGVRGLAALCGVFLLWRCWLSFQIPDLDRADRQNANGTNHQTSLAESEVPTKATALLVLDHAGQWRWTVFIPHTAGVPSDADYEDVYIEGRALGESLASHSLLSHLMSLRQPSFYAHDDAFLDVAAAESAGTLPRGHQRSVANTCETSLTFVMRAQDASFGKTLLMLWMSYGLAKKEGRAFFIDDSQWAYGRFSDFFASLPAQSCSPPPQHYMLPYPHQAKHLVVSAATARWTFGQAFEAEYTKRRAHGSDKQRPVFDLLRTGFEDLFKVIGEDALYAQSRIAKFQEDAAMHGGSIVGMQIRRGDLHPLENQYSRDYLPLERYGSAACQMFRSLLHHTGVGEVGADEQDFSSLVEYTHSPLLLASDDPDIFESPELIHASAPFTIQKVQERILLATKAALDASSPRQSYHEPGTPYIKHVDENTGWERGFFSALFYSLGRPTQSPTLSRLSRLQQHSWTAQPDVPVSEEGMRMRQLIARSFLLDLRILAESDGVVCAVSSAMCRLIAVMQGWDAVQEGRWHNVDDGRPWSWNGKG